MKLVLIGGIAALVGGGVYMHGPLRAANVYDMSAGEAYQKLAAAKVEPSGTGPFGRLDTIVSGSGNGTVEFSATGSHAALRCVATVAPEGSGKARVDASCGGGGAGNGAANGLFLNQIRKGFIELLDSTLKGRAYDPGRAQGATAARWPEDVIDHGDFNSAVSEAQRMDAEARVAAQADSQPAPDEAAPGGWGPEAEPSR
jgi:hypothetical protein